ncbi:respiratory burst oxidase homolog protein E-like [Magnolia sinica]|uniref:respiratory burst oxidase homolog protein E-like n=1 Tax=Magnolia sinica TaxID=86752 RepID=UPI00265831C9|nr:respiratory burst oxidase homolog protein E-like isoform X2 [Magnolia sinica]XP_058103673.1 respiratory burst oxidase homolog protein E-like [Magnolia sinica]
MQRENNRRGSTRGEDFSSLLPYAAMASAFTNKLLKSKEQAEEYPFFIMEELNPKNFGYITDMPQQLKVRLLEEVGEHDRERILSGATT